MLQYLINNVCIFILDTALVILPNDRPIENSCHNDQEGDNITVDPRHKLWP